MKITSNGLLNFDHSFHARIYTNGNMIERVLGPYVTSQYSKVRSPPCVVLLNLRLDLLPYKCHKI